MRRLVGLALLALCFGCGPGEQTQSSSTPGDVGNVNCSTEATSSTGWTKFGATIGAWNATHERDPNYLEWGPVLGDGRRAYPIVRCSNDGRVIALEKHMYPPVTATEALASAKTELPADVKLVYDVTQAQCRNIQYQSASLAAEMGTDNTDGIADLQLESPLVGADVSYHADTVETARIDLLDAYSVKPTGC